MPDFDVHAHGKDTSGRDIFATDFMWAWWEAVVDALGFRPTIVQGAFMSRVPGGGASDSAGYHDEGGCFDLRTWDRTEDEVEAMVRTLRRRGAAAWRRDQRHGMDPHLHFVLGADRPLADGAAYQWRQYVDGHNGLASNGPDYEWRPSPLVLTPPEDDMFTEKDRNNLEAALAAVRDLANAERERARNVKARDLRLAANLRASIRDNTGDIRETVERIAAELEGESQ